MDRLLTASSPVEIEARSGEAGLTPEAHDASLALFHELTDRIGQAARLMPGHGSDLSRNRFYFADSGSARMAALVGQLRQRPDLAELEENSSSLPSEPTGLFSVRSAGGVTGLMVKHETHEGLPGTP